MQQTRNNFVARSFVLLKIPNPNILLCIFVHCTYTIIKYSKYSEKIYTETSLVYLLRSFKSITSLSGFRLILIGFDVDTLLSSMAVTIIFIFFFLSIFKILSELFKLIQPLDGLGQNNSLAHRQHFNRFSSNID